MAVRWREFQTYILPDMPGCPLSSITAAARSAAIEFCQETQLWIMNSELNAILAGHAIYTPDVPDGVEVAAIIKAQFIQRDMSGNERVRQDLMPLNDSDLVRMGNWETLRDRIPLYYRVYEPHRIQLIPSPTETISDSLVMSVAVKPAYNAKFCPQFILSSHAEAIGYGAKARLAAIPNKTWSNPAMVQFYQGEFQNIINAVKRGQNAAQSRKGLSVRRRRF